jgi:hypothetical protein
MGFSRKVLMQISRETTCVHTTLYSVRGLSEFFTPATAPPFSASSSSILTLWVRHFVRYDLAQRSCDDDRRCLILELKSANSQHVECMRSTDLSSIGLLRTPAWTMLTREKWHK